MNKQLYRSRDDRMLTGLAGGVAKYFDMDANLVRIILVVLTFMTTGFLFLAYLICAAFVPTEPLDSRKKVKNKPE